MNEEIVFIVDDDNSVLDSLSILLQTIGYETEPYDSGQAFLDNYDSAKSGCLLLDMLMPNMTGLELMQKLREMQINIPTIIITAYGDIPSAVKAMQLGAIDFLEKPYREDIIVEKVNYALQLGNNVREQDAALHKFQDLFKQLTSREVDVYKEMVKGLANKVIARNLDISHRTVEIHRAHVMEKLQLDSLAQLIRLSIQSDIS
jgi:two-component system, LuxR family, response regulator FixJ